jgi:hypothetical protein
VQGVDIEHAAFEEKILDLVEVGGHGSLLQCVSRR